MKYSELLMLYKEGRLDKALQEQVEADIERQEAISGYLFEKEEQAGLEILAKDLDTEGSSTVLQGGDKWEQDNINPDFTKMVNRAIRRFFFKVGACITAVTLAVVLFIIFLLPALADSFYYNPAKSVGEHGNQLSLDLAVYTELCVPENNRSSASVKAHGYGSYDIMLPQDFSYNGSFTNLAGKIEKGTLDLYDADALNCPVQNVFAWFQMEGDSSGSLSNLIDKKKKTNYCAAGNARSAAEALHELDEHAIYTAYVTLDRMMPYEKFMKYINQISKEIQFDGVWCAVCTKNGIKPSGSERFYAENLGFNCTLLSSHNLDWDREKYPYLLLWNETSDDVQLTEELENNMQKEEFMKMHFTSMLRYMADQEQFLTMMGRQPQNYHEAADYVEKNGLVVYGFACIAKKDAVLKLEQQDEIYEIFTQVKR